MCVCITADSLCGHVLYLSVIRTYPTVLSLYLIFSMWYDISPPFYHYIPLSVDLWYCISLPFSDVLSHSYAGVASLYVTLCLLFSNVLSLSLSLPLCDMPTLFLSGIGSLSFFDKEPFTLSLRHGISLPVSLSFSSVILHYLTWWFGSSLSLWCGISLSPSPSGISLPLCDLVSLSLFMC